MKRIITVILFCASLGHDIATGGTEPVNRLGAGANYWKTIKHIDFNDVDKNGFSWLLTYQYAPGSPLSLEADLELFRSGFAGTSDEVLAPQAYIVLGTSIYGALGIGTYYSDGEFAEDPFYAIRLGFDFPVIQPVYIDINVSYRFNDWENIRDMARNINSDTITVGAAIRVEF